MLPDVEEIRKARSLELGFEHLLQELLFNATVFTLNSRPGFVIRFDLGQAWHVPKA